MGHQHCPMLLWKKNAVGIFSLLFDLLTLTQIQATTDQWSSSPKNTCNTPATVSKFYHCISTINNTSVNKKYIRIDVQRKGGSRQKKRKKLKFLETFFCVSFPLGFLLSPLWFFPTQKTSLSSIFTAGQQSESSEEWWGKLPKTAQE